MMKNNKIMTAQQITPRDIINIINELYDVDISEKGVGGKKRLLRPVYYYLCIKYCNSLVYNYSEIAKEVNVKHSSVSLMTSSVGERIGIKGYEELTSVLKRLCSVIEDRFSESPDYLENIKLDNYDVLILKNKLKAFKKRVWKLQCEKSKLKSKLNERSRIKV